MTSFDVVWNNNLANIKGKVFARKRKVPVKKNAADLVKSDNFMLKAIKDFNNSRQVITTETKLKTKTDIPIKQSISGEQKLREEAKKDLNFSRPDKITRNDTTTKPASPINKHSSEDKGRRRKFTPTNISHKPSEDGNNRLVKRKNRKDKQIAADLMRAGEKPAVASKKDSKSHSLFSEKHKTKNITNIKGVSVVEKVFNSNLTFKSLDIHRHIISNLEKSGFTTLTNVQEKAIPVVLNGGNVLIRSQTGSGKTLAYAVPIIEALQSIDPRLNRSNGLQALVIVPTRELALQTHEIFSKICTFQWIVVGHLCGGENRNTEKNRLRKGTHVLIATPGRLLDHILHTSSFKVDNVRCLVLDEADRLLDMGFKKDIIKIVEELDKAKENKEYDPIALLRGNKDKVTDIKEEPVVETSYCLRNHNSKTRQTLLLSATLSKGIAELADFTMKEHTYIDALEESLNINPEHMIIPRTVKQEFLISYIKHRLITLASILISKSNQNCKILVFMATSQMVDFHYELFSNYLVKMPISRGKLKSGNVVLLDEGIEMSEDEEVVMDVNFFKLHGSMQQGQRKEEFLGFKKAKRGILLCTDVAARGIDVPEADFVIQYTGPQTDEDYLHRVGRTGRVDHSGTALIFLTHEEQQYVTHLQGHKVFLKERDPSEFSSHLCNFMEEPDKESAAIGLQRRFERAVSENKDLYKLACFAYSSWSRFYNSYPAKLRKIFNFQMANLGHYVTSFALRDTPSTVAKVVRGQVANIQPKRLNKKLATHVDSEEPKKSRKELKRKIKSISLATSEFDSGLDFKKKKKK